MAEPDRGIDEMLEGWVKAELEGGREPARRALDRRLHSRRPLGFVLSKQAWLARYEQGTFRNEAFRLEEIQTRVHGNVTLVTAHQIQKSFFGESEVPFTDLRATLVVVSESDEWRLAGVHMSFIANTPGAPEVAAP